MGIKSTIHLTRANAIVKFAYLKSQDPRTRRQFEEFEDEATAMTDKELENELERINDRAHDGQGFENYIVNG